MRLIDADEFDNLIYAEQMKYADDKGNYTYRILEAMRADVRNCPTVDAIPVVHGKWIVTGGMKPPEYHHHHQCSVCEAYAPMRPPYGSREMLTPWCPGCNAKMDLEEQQS